MSVEPTNVYPPGPYPGGPQQSQSGQQGRVYVVQQPPDQTGGIFSRTANRIPARPQTVDNPLSRQMPQFLRGTLNNRAIVFNMWLISMIIVGFDEWHNLGILPRPARLWDTSLLYGLLVIAGFVDAAVPIANILAIGFTIALATKYFQGGITPNGSTKTTKGSTRGTTATPKSGPTS
jgi:hypothetical protein